MMNPIQIFQDQRVRQEFLTKFLLSDFALLNTPILIVLFLACLLNRDIASAYKCLSEISHYDKVILQRAAQRLRFESILGIFYIEFAKTGPGFPARSFLGSLLDSIFPAYGDQLFNGVGKGEIALDPFDRIEHNRSQIDYCCIFRKHWWEFDKNSRLHDMGPRVNAALNRSGGRSRLCHITEPEISAAIATKIDTRYSVAIIDCQSVDLVKLLRSDPSILVRIRQRFDRVVAYAADAWRDDSLSFFNNYREFIDLAWVQGRSQAEELKFKFNIAAFSFPVPLGIDFEAHERNLLKSPKLLFHGSIEDTNISRVFWHNSLAGRSDILSFSLHTHRSDNLTPLDSFHQYLTRLSNFYGGLSLVARGTGYRSPISRSFETMHAEALLVQEYSEDFARFMTPMVHFLDFRSIADLEVILDNLLRDPSFYDDIRVEGLKRVRSVLSDSAFVEHLYYMLDL